MEGPDSTKVVQATDKRLPPNAGKGRVKGVPNKATTAVREAIAVFAEANVGKMGEWLERIAEDSPDKALSLYLQAIEYHIPKLARTEVTGEDGGPLQVSWPLPKPKVEG